MKLEIKTTRYSYKSVLSLFFFSLSFFMGMGAGDVLY